MLKQRTTITATLFTAVLSLGVLAGCDYGDMDKPAPTPGQQEAVRGHEQHFSGTFPCSDCKGIYNQLTIKFTEDGQPDGFIMNSTFLGQEEGDNHTFTTSGELAVLTGMPDDAKAVVFHVMPDTEGEPAVYYRRTDENTLQMWDNDMKPVMPQENHRLVRDAQ